MPKCSQCGEPASVFLSFVKGGKVTKICLCQVHAEEVEAFSTKGFGVLKLGKSGQELPSLNRTEVVRCEVCGFSQKDFEKFGRFGCPSCYETFGRQLRPVLDKLHSGTRHMGKIPAKAIAQGLINDRIRRLEDQMEQAVASERYEEAACFRDKISAIKQLSLKPPHCEVIDN